MGIADQTRDLVTVLAMMRNYIEDDYYTNTAMLLTLLDCMGVPSAEDFVLDLFEDIEAEFD